MKLRYYYNFRAIARTMDHEFLTTDRMFIARRATRRNPTIIMERLEDGAQIAIHKSEFFLRLKNIGK